MEEDREENNEEKKKERSKEEEKGERWEETVCLLLQSWMDSKAGALEPCPF